MKKNNGDRAGSQGDHVMLNSRMFFSLHRLNAKHMPPKTPITFNPGSPTPGPRFLQTRHPNSLFHPALSSLVLLLLFKRAFSSRLLPT